MLRNEAGHDGAAAAVDNAITETSLYNQIADTLSDPTTLAVLAGGALATAAAVKYGRPLLELAKSAGDDALLATIREASKGAPQGETTILGVVRGSRIEPATEALLADSIPISSSVRDLSKPLSTGDISFAQGVMGRASVAEMAGAQAAGEHAVGKRASMAGTLAPKPGADFVVEEIGGSSTLRVGATDAILSHGVPIDRVAAGPLLKSRPATLQPATDAIARHSVPIERAGLTPATDALVKGSKPIVGESDHWSVEAFLKPPFSRVLRDMPPSPSPPPFRPAGSPLKAIAPSDRSAQLASILGHEVPHPLASTKMPKA